MTSPSRLGFRSAAPATLVLVALAGLLSAGGSLPHIHAGSEPGVYNLDHDLTSLATFGGGGPLTAVVSAVPLVTVVSAAAPPGPDRAASAPGRLAASRAPPTR